MSLPVWAIAGAKVVCIEEAWEAPSADVDIPSFAPGYRDVLTIARADAGFLFFVELPELWALPDGRVGEISWPVACFRPLATFESDQELFAPLLNQRQPERADA